MVFHTKDVASVAVISPLVGLLLLVAVIRPVSQKLYHACSYAVAGRAEIHCGLQVEEFPFIVITNRVLK